MARVKNPVRPGDGDPRHGRASTYGNHRCRCDGCRDAWRRLCADMRAQRVAAQDVTVLAHGRYTTYKNWGCRCEDCTDAVLAYQRAWYARKRAAS